MHCLATGIYVIDAIIDPNQSHLVPTRSITQSSKLLTKDAFNLSGGQLLQEVFQGEQTTR